MSYIFRSLVVLSIAGLLAACDSSQHADSARTGNGAGENSAFAKTEPELVFDAETGVYQSRFNAAASQAPNFAEHFILTRWGCGTDCQMGGVIDVDTGATYLIPFTVCCGFESGEDVEMMEFRLDSNLIIFNGLLNEDDSAGRRHVYVFENGEFILSPPVAGGSWQCRNDLEISCGDGRCSSAEQGSFTPMSVTLSETGAMSVCAYTGCWEGNARFEHSDNFGVWIGHELVFSTAPDSATAKENIVIALDKTDGLATLKAGEFALPLLCERAEPK